MKKLIALAAFLLLVNVVCLKAQSSYDIQFIHKIDSLAQEKNLTYATVVIRELSNSLDKLDTRQEILVYRKIFAFDGALLVVDNHYFPVNNILYFTLEKDGISFCLKSY